MIASCLVAVLVLGMIATALAHLLSILHQQSICEQQGLPSAAELQQCQQRETSPNWNHIYAMEREIYGRTFEHAGAPLPSGCGDLTRFRETGTGPIFGDSVRYWSRE